MLTYPIVGPNLPNDVAVLIRDEVVGNPDMVLPTGRPQVTYADIRDTLSMDWQFYYDLGTHIYYRRKADSDNPNDLIPFDDRSAFLNDLLNDLEENGTKTDKRRLGEALFTARTCKDIK